MALKINIKTLQSMAQHYGGKCMSKEYVDVHLPLQWMCENGHTWDSSYEIVNQGGWCRQCLRRQKYNDNYLEKVKAIAISKGGKCLSTQYIDGKHKLDWQCAEGHKWSVIPIGIVHYNTWCGKCAIKRNSEKARGTIETMQNIALKHGGKCLSTVYVGTNTKLQWQCSEGHKWMGTPGNAVTGYWCKKCSNKNSGIKRRASIEEYQMIAKERGGKLISKTYNRNDFLMLWECNEGHRWKAKGNSIKSGSWCQKCGHKKGADKIRDKIETFQSIAIKRGGKCLSEIYKDSNTKLEFECAEGHIWKSSPITIKHAGCWCPKCGAKKNGDRNRGTIEDCIKLAADRGGRCLSTVFIHSHSPLGWKCAEGHRWKTTSNLIKKGTWCPKCANKRTGDKQRDKIETFQKIALKRGGKCLSVNYVDSHTKLEFECSKGHSWKMAPGSIKNLGLWCKICKADEKKK